MEILEKKQYCLINTKDLSVLLCFVYYLVWKVENEVVVTRKGQTTIPAKLRKKFKIEKGTRLEVVETEEGILFKPKMSTWDLTGSGAKFATPEEMKKLLDKLREEDV